MTMQLAQMIEELQAIHEQHGDIPVYINNRRDWCVPISLVEAAWRDTDAEQYDDDDEDLRFVVDSVVRVAIIREDR